jgi:hypothetical protein
MNYKDDVVASAIQGLKDGGFAHAELFRPLMERVYECGYRECLRNVEETEAIRKYSGMASKWDDGFMTPVR